MGIAYVASSLEKAGFQVEIFDNYLLEKPIDEVKIKITKLRPEIVGITCGSATYSQCIATAKAIKEVHPSCKIVVGGWHPSYKPDSMLEHPEIDYVVVGEGERAMVELATHITRDAKTKDALTIPGVAFRYEGKTVETPPKFIGNCISSKSLIGPFTVSYFWIFSLIAFMKRLACCGVRIILDFTLLLGVPGITFTKSITNSACE